MQEFDYKIKDNRADRNHQYSSLQKNSFHTQKACFILYKLLLF